MLLESTQFDPIRFCFVLFFFVFFLVVVVFWLSFVLYFFLEKKISTIWPLLRSPVVSNFFQPLMLKKEIMIMTMKFHYFKNATFFLYYVINIPYRLFEHDSQILANVY